METDFDSNSFTSLKTRSKQTCDICDVEFNDRYSCIVHSASHIVIPLLKELGFCNICNSYFTSDEFNTHTSKHQTIKREPNVEIIRPEIQLQNLLIDETFTVKQEHNDLEMDSNVSDDEFAGDEIKIDTGDDCIEKYDEIIPSIKTKLKFEDDCEFDSLKDFAQCQVDVYTEWSYCNNSLFGEKEYKEYTTCGIMYEEANEEFECGDHGKPDVPFLCDGNYQSVHYTELKCDAVVTCRYCKLTFSNRFNLVLHETKHMRLRRAGPRFLLCLYCDRYIAGNYHNLDKHLANKHTNCSRRKCWFSKCEKCHLPYRSYFRHVMNYHQRVCGDSVMKHDEDPVSKTHCRENVYTHHLIKMCDVCYTCNEKNNTFKYVLMGSSSDANKHRCHLCNKSYIKLKTVKKIRNRKMKWKDQKKGLTNEERLKKILHRLKTINKLSKLYYEVLF